jgi:hypothetical protein
MKIKAFAKIEFVLSGSKRWTSSGLVCNKKSFD